MVLGGFIVLALAGLLLRGWGVVLGAVLLTWGIAGALGKVTGPMSMLFRDSTKTTALHALSLALGGLVTTCGVMGTVTERNKAEREAAARAERERREAEEAAARAARDTELRREADDAAASYEAGLDEVDALLTSGKWREATTRLEAVSALVAEYQRLDPVPKGIASRLARGAKLARALDARRRAHEAALWIENAEAVVGDEHKCDSKEEVEAAMVQVTGLVASDPGYATIQELNARLRTCLEEMPPPSAWRYGVSRDPMGGVVGLAEIESSNALEFDFPYQGLQHATLTIRRDPDLDVMLSIEQGQFMCTLGCSVMVRFDDGPATRWRATGTADHSTTTVFLRRESRFVKELSSARRLRVEATFFQEGSRVLDFAVARFDSSQLSG